MVRLRERLGCTQGLGLTNIQWPEPVVFSLVRPPVPPNHEPRSFGYLHPLLRPRRGVPVMSADAVFAVDPLRPASMPIRAVLPLEWSNFGHDALIPLAILRVRFTWRKEVPIWRAFLASNHALHRRH